MSTINVIIADDHPVFRNGLENILKFVKQISKIRQANNGREVLEHLEKEVSEIVFMDINMPVMDGIAATKQIHKQYPAVKVIALSMHDDRENIKEMFNAGAVGYLLKNTNKDEIEEAIREVLAGNVFYTKEVSDVLLRNMLHTNASKLHHSNVEEPLSDREKEVLGLICKQFSTKEIADQLFISERTVEGHRVKLLQKTGSKNIAGLVYYAIENGLAEKP
jgi:two-component system, NarL family, response regulator DegU